MKARKRRVREQSGGLVLLLCPIVLSFALACADILNSDDDVYLFPHSARQGDLIYMVVGGNLIPTNLASAFEEGAYRPGEHFGLLDGTPRPIFSLSRDDVSIEFCLSEANCDPTPVSPIAVFPLVADPSSHYSTFFDYPDVTVEIAAFVVPNLAPDTYIVRPTDNPHANAMLEVLGPGGDSHEPHNPALPLLQPKAVLRLLLQRGGDVAGSTPIDPAWEVGAISLTLQSDLYWGSGVAEPPFTVSKVFARADAAGAVALSEGTAPDGLSEASTRLHIIAPNGIHFTEPIDGDVETLGRGPFLDLVVNVHPAFPDLRAIPVWVEDLTMWDVDGNLLRSGPASLPNGQADFVRVLAVHNPEL